MKKRTLAPPNYVATVRFMGEAKDKVLILFSLDAPSLEARLKNRYPFVDVKSIEPYDFEVGWGKTAKDCRDAVDLARANNQAYDFDKNSIWGELKECLFDLFDNYCAYCESEFRAGNPGAVEHYRPKRPVSGVPGHPGYYWLAYDVTNYLPTCSSCNSAKSNAFPLVDGAPRAAAPGEEAAEQPLLLNPCRLAEEVTGHLTFTQPKPDSDEPGPLARGLTPQGKESVKRLDLNRHEVFLERMHEQERAVGDYFTQRSTGANPPPVLAQLNAGARPYSTASLVMIAGAAKFFPAGK